MLNFVKPLPTPSIWKRIQQSARYTINGIRPDTWMSPLQPLPPYDPVVEPRQYDYPVGYNLFYNNHGRRNRYSFEELRNFSRNSELTRMSIETRQDQVSAMKWLIKPRTEVDGADNDPRLKQITDFFAKPDKIRDWDQWLRLILEELFVTDAVSLARKKTRGGGLFSLEPIDGATIFPLIDENGRQPLPPDPAYQQILKGVPKADYTSDELIYYVRKSQVNTPFGYSVVEQIVTSCKTDIERAQYTLAYFSEGSVPDAYITAPDGMTADRVIAYETHLNGLLAGNAAGRRQMPVLVHGMEMKSLKQAELKNEFDEWIARKICNAFGLPATPYIRQLNRSTAESDKDRAQEEGLFPVLLYLKRLLDRVIREDFDSPDLEFAWDDNEERDPKTQAEIDVMYVNSGIRARNEVRDDLGLEDRDGADELLVTGTGGLLPLPNSELDLQQKQEQQEQQEQSSAQSHQNTLELIQAKGAKGAPGAPGAAKSVSVKKKFLCDESHSH